MKTALTKCQGGDFQRFICIITIFLDTSIVLRYSKIEQLIFCYVISRR